MEKTFVRILEEKYWQRAAVDNAFQFAQRKGAQKKCREIIVKDCLYIAYYQAMNSVRYLPDTRDKDNTITELAIDAVAVVLEKYKSNSLKLGKGSITKYISGIIRRKISSQGISFRRKDFPKDVRNAGPPAIELYAWRVELNKSRSECNALLIERFSLKTTQQREDVFKVVEPYMSKAHVGGKDDAVSLDSFHFDGETRTYDVADSRFSPEGLYQDKELKLIIEKILAMLPPQESQIIGWIYKYGEKNIASRIKQNFNVKSVYYEIEKAKEAFRKILKDNGIDSGYFS